MNLLINNIWDNSDEEKEKPMDSEESSKIMFLKEKIMVGGNGKKKGTQLFHDAGYKSR